MTKDIVQKDKTQNQVNVIYPKRNKHGIWTFTDPEVGLQDEPFVGNCNLMLDNLTNGGKEAIVYISHDPIANYNAHLVKVTDPAGGVEPGWYKLKGTNLTGWLCPATLKYFDGYPDNIYILITNKS